MRDDIKLFLGDITDAEVDAVVNAANNELLLGSGVAGAIRRRGGPTIQSECNEHGPVAVGEAAITGAGDLKARYVLHAASMRLGGGATAESIRSSMRHCFRLAGENGVESIAIPAIGAGVAGFPIRRCVDILVGEAIAALNVGKVSEVQFHLFEQVAWDAFQDALEELEES